MSAAHSSTPPLPPPMRTSSGFFVTGRSGKIRIQSLPARFTWRVIAIRAASICRDVKRPGSSDCRPKSPNATFEPRHARPRLLPFCIFRYFVRFGESIVLTSCSGDPAGFSGQDFALEHPDLDADDSVRRLRFGRAELDVGAERVERDPALAVGLDAAHL